MNTPAKPLAGRRIWFVGIGGAGLSAYAQLADAWGAEVGGWDRVSTPYLAHLDGVDVTIGPEPEAPPGWEVVVSSAFRFPGRSRAELLAELVALRNAIVVAGSHGKGTTAAMIAFVLRECGRDPSFLIGADVPQLGGNAGAGGGWLVVEGDESDRTVAALRPRIAVVTNLELDHHTTFASTAELVALFEDWLAEVPLVVRDAEPADIELALPGEHNRRNAGAALEAVRLAGVSRAEAAPVLARFRGSARRFEAHDVGAVVVVDDYAHHPTEISATLAAARERWPERRQLVLFQPHLYSRTRHLAAEFGAALAAADRVAVADVYPARELPIPGVTGKLVVDALSDRGRLAAWTPSVEAGIEQVLREVRAGDVVVILGAGDVDRAAPLLLERLR